MQEQVSKDLKLKNIYKKIVVAGVFLLSIFLLINISWGIKTRNDYKEVVKYFEKNQNLFTLNRNNMKYSIVKPKYLSFYDNKELVARTHDNNLEWIFSNNENYGKVYVKFSDGGESSLIINSKLRFDEKANQEIGLSFSKEEQEDIDAYLTKNQKELLTSFENSYKMWKKIQ